MITPLPALDGWPEFEDALAKRDRLAADLRQAQADLEALTAGTADAARADEDARAGALISGRKDPGPKIVTKHTADLAEARSLAGVLETAVAQADAAVMTLLRSERGRAAEAAADALELAREGYRQALDGLQAARATFWTAQRASGWVENDLLAGRRWKPTGPPGVTVAGASTPNGEALTLGPVLEALHAETGDAPRWVQGAWPGTLLPESERGRLIPRTRRDFTGDPNGRTVVHYVIAEDQLAADTAAAATEAAAHGARDAEKTAALIRAQAARDKAQPAQGDPLADLRERA